MAPVQWKMDLENTHFQWTKFKKQKQMTVTDCPEDFLRHCACCSTQAGMLLHHHRYVAPPPQVMPDISLNAEVNDIM